MNPELIKIAQQLMQQNPGMTPEQALREAGRMGQMAQQQYAATQGGPAMGQVPGDRPQVMPGLLGGNQPTPQGQAPHPGIQPQQQQSHPMCGPGTSFDGQQCVSNTISAKF